MPTCPVHVAHIRTRGTPRPENTPGPGNVVVQVSGVDRGRPPVLLEPGLGASSVGWARLRDRLCEQTQVITYDRAGLGASPPSAGPRGLDALGTDLAHVIHTHGHGAPVVLVGHSLGATLARHLWVSRPDLVAGLVLIDPVPEYWLLCHGPWVAPFGRLGYRVLEALARMGAIDTALALPLLRGITRSSTSPLAAFTAAERAALAGEVRDPASHRAAEREFTGFLRHSRSALRALHVNPYTSVPLTVISGGRSSAIGMPLREAVIRWHAQLVTATPAARHLVIHDGSHFIPRYRPDVVVAAVIELLGTVAGNDQDDRGGEQDAPQPEFA